MVQIELWLYGPLAQYAGTASQVSHAQLHLDLPVGTKMRDLLAKFGIPLEEKGITFVNGDLTDMPGLGADLERELRDGDRVGIFDLKSMWPFQYRFGASTSPEIQEAMKRRGMLHHGFSTTAPPEESKERGGDVK